MNDPLFLRRTIAHKKSSITVSNFYVISRDNNICWYHVTKITEVIFLKEYSPLSEKPFSCAHLSSQLFPVGESQESGVFWNKQPYFYVGGIC